MSGRLETAVLHDGPRDPAKRLLLWAFADFADHRTGECFPSMKRVAEMAGLSVRTARRLVGDLEADGWISRRAENGPTGRQTTNRYVLNLEKLGVKRPKPLEEDPDKLTGSVPGQSDRGGGQVDRGAPVNVTGARPGQIDRGNITPVINIARADAAIELDAYEIDRRRSVRLSVERGEALETTVDARIAALQAVVDGADGVRPGRSVAKP